MNKIESKIGLKAKQLRLDHKMTLKDLSQKTNLSVGYLSQFERGINTIAVDSLNKIAQVYGVELSYFFPEEKKHQDSILVKSYDQTLLDVLGNNYIVKLLSNKNKDSSLYPRLIEILPQITDETLQSYPHEGEEFIYVLEGVLSLVHQGREYTMYPGDSAHYQSDVDHNWINQTNKTVKILCISFPNPFSSQAKE